MRIKQLTLISALSILGLHSLYSQCFSCRTAPPGTIFCDDFEDNIPFDQKYFEYNNNGGDFIRMQEVGRDKTYGMRVKWQKAEVGAGSLSKSFGKTPDTYIGKNAANPNETFDEIYWRMDVMSQNGWIGGGPAKLSRAMCLANSNWAQGMMAHLWSGGPGDEFLGMDPASGIGTDGKLKSTKYNDFNNLRWLGFKYGSAAIYNSQNAGKWFCIVGHVKLNTPGQKDGIFEFWINDTLQASSKNLDWHSTWNNDTKNLHINAIFFENYWNAGSPVEQERYFDNLVISTKEIPCSCNTVGSIDNKAESVPKIYTKQNQKTLIIEIQEDLLPIPVTLYNLQNQIITERIITNKIETIDLSQIYSGFYLLKVKNQKPFKLIVLNP